MKKTYIVIGLGRFGRALAERLCELGNEVLAIDTSAECVQHAENSVTCAVVGDARDEGVLRSLGARNYDCAIVAIGSNLASSVIITLNLKSLGVKQVICKAQDEIQRRALEKVGADRVIIPEREIGIKLAQSLTSSGVLDFIELSPDIGIAEVSVPESWVGKSLRELNVRAKYDVNVIAVRRSGALELTMDAGSALEAGMVLIVLGPNDALANLQKR